MTLRSVRFATYSRVEAQAFDRSGNLVVLRSVEAVPIKIPANISIAPSISWARLTGNETTSFSDYISPGSNRTIEFGEIEPFPTGFGMLVITVSVNNDTLVDSVLIGNGDPAKWTAESHEGGYWERYLPQRFEFSDKDEEYVVKIAPHSFGFVGVS